MCLSVCGWVGECDEPACKPLAICCDEAVVFACPPQSPGAIQSAAVTAVGTRPGQYLYQVSEALYTQHCYVCC